MPKPNLQGTGADLYLLSRNGKKLVRRVLRKSVRGRTLAGQVAFEAQLAKYVLGQPFAANFVSSDASSITYEYVNGRDLFYSADAKKVGEALASLHSFSCASPPKFAPYAPAAHFVSGLFNNFEEAKIRKHSGESSDAAIKIIRESLSDLNSHAPAKSGSSPGCLVHNDLTSGNILVDDDGRARLIDWSWAAHSDCALDLLSFSCPIVTSWEYEHILSQNAAGDFASAYFSARKLADAEEQSVRSQARALSIPYFAGMLCWLFSGEPLSDAHRSAQKRFASKAFLKSAFSAVSNPAF